MASGWVCPTTFLNMDGFNWDTLQHAQRRFSKAGIAGDDLQPSSGVVFVDEVAWTLLGKRIVLVLSGLKVFMYTDLKGSHAL